MRKPGLGSLVMLMGLAGTGCASAERERLAQGPVAIPDPSALPHVVVYGDLARVLPKYDKTSALESFLYGPNDFGKTTLCNPQGMAVLGRRLLVCDQGISGLVAIDLDSGRSLLWGDPDHQPHCPVGVAVGPEGRVYVADTTRRAVIVYRHDGSFEAELIQPDEGEMAFVPCSVLMADGILYVGNRGQRRVDRFDPRNRQWLTPLAPPAGALTLIAPTGLAATKDGVLLIADAVRGDVSRVTSDGRWLDPIGQSGRGEGQFVRPKQVCVIPSGLILVSDAGRQSVLVFDPQGRSLFEVHERPGQWEGLTLPMALVVLKPGELPNSSQNVEAYVVVSDTMGSVPLTLMAVVVRGEEGKR